MWSVSFSATHWAKAQGIFHWPDGQEATQQKRGGRTAKEGTGSSPSFWRICSHFSGDTQQGYKQSLDQGWNLWCWEKTWVVFASCHQCNHNNYFFHLKQRRTPVRRVNFTSHNPSSKLMDEVLKILFRSTPNSSFRAMSAKKRKGRIRKSQKEKRKRAISNCSRKSLGWSRRKAKKDTKEEKLVALLGKQLLLLFQQKFQC